MEKDQDEDEEEKIKKFFALVRSTREVRELMVKSANKLREEEEKKKGEEDKSSMAVLNPSFHLEDFIEGGGGKSKFPQASPEAGPSSKRQDDETEKEEDKEGGGGDHHGLDLKLSL
ncbi:hypothetical protein RHGRI_014351 [Rhododendron griersonianum]|uniref:Uncharacterized protein n=1 Tax=Rhododendron griersonianum TaxID=479676 RepID=A0AAV6K8Z4_9ERIC|nr:hypothetical protein RHGRI_014351 [Rhododendron griersonianum]